MSSRQASIKKHTRSPKETATVYFIGLAFSIYLGILMGAVYLEGNSLSEFMANFNEFVINERHFIVGFT
ncbi:MAG: hypothetical protein K6E75_04140, partial [Lachnospiraceae bacterium]|nr:hypothetical protein [Lachnospiraceae bacterium]